MNDTSARSPIHTDTPAFYNISQAAEQLGVSRVTIWRWIRDGRLPVARLGHRTTRIAPADLDRLVAQMGRPGARAWVGRTLDADAPRADWRDGGAHDHFVQLYEVDASLLDAVAEFVGAALRAGDAGVVIATQAHQEGIAERLGAEGIDLDDAAAAGRFVALDAGETLATFMAGGMPDFERFHAVVGDVIARAAGGGRRVHAFGEMVALLVLAGNHAATVRLEALWNELRRVHRFALFCAYPMSAFDGEADTSLLADVCAEHTGVIPAESYSGLRSPDERLRTIAALQQKARRLEAEVAERERAQAALRQALEAERAARAAAQDALRVRDEFLATAAHELKTPLTTLSGQAQLVLRLLARSGSMRPSRRRCR
jgi:excisionase family DNA binding protein